MRDARDARKKNTARHTGEPAVKSALICVYLSRKSGYFRTFAETKDKMKRHLILYALIGLIAVCLVQGCKQTAEETLSPELAQAEAVMFEHPDSALHILETMQKPDASNEEQHALWCLLVTQAQYKQSFTFHSDSLIRIAYEYYRPTDNSRRKALSALYMGNVNYELKHITEAMDYF